MNSRDIIRSLMTNSESVIYFKDAEGKFVLVNQRWIDLYGVELSDIVGKDHFGNYSSKIAAEARKQERLVEESNQVHTVEERITQEGQIHYYLSTRFPVHDEKGQLIGSGTLSTEMTEQKQLEDDLRQTQLELEEMAMLDPLTRACSRASFYEKAEFEVLRHRRYLHTLSILILDIDQFHLVEERFGHEIGDQTLVRLVGLIREVLRDTDIVCRLERDRFAIIAQETDTHEAYSLAKRLLKAVREEEFYRVEALTAGIGLAQLVEGDETSAVIGRALEALSQAKSEGKNRIVVNDM